MLRLVLTCLALCFSYNIALAKYCVKLPSCEELGYVFPYKEGRRQIRCPFDTDKALYLDYCQAYGIQGKPDEVAGEYQECIEEKADGTKINTGYYRYTRCNVGYRYESGHCVNSRIKYNIGDIYYHNGTAIGVVFFDDGNTTKILALKNIDSSGAETEDSANGIYWSMFINEDYKYDVENLANITKDQESKAIADIDGKSNTARILSYVSANGKTARAATATSLYAPSICSSGTICAKGNWYLPAFGELYIMYNNYNTIKNTLINTGGTKLDHNIDIYVWSSTESSDELAWFLHFGRNDWSTSGKFSSGYVRPVLAF